MGRVYDSKRFVEGDPPSDKASSRIMCYAIPGKVVGIKGRLAIVEYFGELRKVHNEFVEIKLGDYVYAQGGFVVQRIPREEALLILKQWGEIFLRLKEVDSRISRLKRHVVREEIARIIERGRKEQQLSREEMLKLLALSRRKEKALLFESANWLRRKHLKNSCCIHGIIEFSNYCENNCFYCGIRKGNQKLRRYRMSIEEIAKIADFAANKLGFKALVLQSGVDPWYSEEMLVELIERIRKRCGVLIFMSIGERSKRCYKKMYEAGARAVLLRFETSNPKLYQALHPGKKKRNLKDRTRLIRYARKLGYLIATGSLIGLPGQRIEDLAMDILLTKKLGAEMWSFGPLIPHRDTPLASVPLPNLDLVLKVLAVSRLVDPRAKILVTTALETLDKRGRRLGLLAGANSLMINVTPSNYRKLYSLYPGKVRACEVEREIEQTLTLLRSLGRAPTDLGLRG